MRSQSCMQREAQTGGRGNSRLITSYRDFAAALTAEGILSDPWVDGAPRFRMTPVWLDRATQGALYARRVRRGGGARGGGAPVRARAFAARALLRSAARVRADVAHERARLARHRARRRVPDRGRPAGLRAQLRHAERRARGGLAQSRRRRRRRRRIRRSQLSARRSGLRAPGGHAHRAAPRSPSASSTRPSSPTISR